jgi:hypothetical protein
MTTTTSPTTSGDVEIPKKRFRVLNSLSVSTFQAISPDFASQQAGENPGPAKGKDLAAGNGRRRARSVAEEGLELLAIVAPFPLPLPGDGVERGQRIGVFPFRLVEGVDEPIGHDRGTMGLTHRLLPEGLEV